MRKIFEQQFIDCETGEINSVTSHYILKNSEKFASYRRTEGIKWICEIDGLDLKILMFLVHFEHPDTHIIALSRNMKDDLCASFKITINYFYKILKRLIENRYVIKIKDELMVNPSFIYQGDSRLLKQRIGAFYQKYDVVYNVDKTNIIEL